MSTRLSRRDFLTKVGVLAGAGLAGSTLAACAPAATPQVIKETVVVEKEVMVTGAPEPLALECKGKVTLGAYVYTPTQVERVENIIKGLTDREPDVEVELIQIPSRLYDKYATMLAGGNEPNLIWMGLGFWRFVGIGAFLDLDPYFEADPDFVREDYYPQVLELFTWQGKLYALPYGFTTSVYAYNQNLFEEDGVPFPSETWTVDDYISVGQALTKDLDGDGRIDQWGVDNPNFTTCMWWLGGDMFSPDYSRVTMDTPEAVHGIQLAYDLSYGKYKVAPTPEVKDEIGFFQVFGSGRMAVAGIGRWGVPEYRKIIGDTFKWDVQVAPNQKGTWLSGESYAISARTENKGAAWCLLKQMCGRETQENVYMPDANATPSIKALAESEAYMNDGKPPENDKAFVESLKFARHTATHPIVMEVSKITNPIWDQVVAGDLTAEEAAKKMQEELTAKLQEYVGVWKE